MKTTLCLCAILAISCVETVEVEPNPISDASGDATSDTTAENIPWNDGAADVEPDAMIDVITDTTVDAAPNMTIDEIPDVMVDVTPDATVDVTPDTTADVIPDATVDVIPDATVDVIPDATIDSPLPIIDAGPDSGLPTCPILCGTHTWACWKIGKSILIDLNDGTFFDPRTCLRWERSITSTSTTYTAAEFSERCKNPSLPGTGWRRPTRIELESLVDYSRMSPSMALSTPYEKFWTSSTTTGATAWTVLFYNGEVAARSISSKYYGRCVSGNGDGELSADPPTGHYTIEGNTVRDNQTGLTWQKGDSQMLNPAPLTTDIAQSYCAGSGMRVPTIAEIQSIVYDYHTPAVDISAFPSTTSANYWTSTPYASNGYLWRINLTDGATVLGTGPSDTAFVKCVQ